MPTDAGMNVTPVRVNVTPVRVFCTAVALAAALTVGGAGPGIAFADRQGSPFALAAAAPADSAAPVESAAAAGSVASLGAATTADAATPPGVAVKVMPLGDSITAGAGSPTHSSYRADLYHRLTAAGMNVDFVGSQASGVGPDPDNEGHSGWTIAQIAEQADNWLATYQPDVVLLHIGTNDVTRGPVGVPAAPARLAALIDQIHADAPAAHIFVAKIIGSRTPARQTQIAAYNAAIPAIVAGSGPLVHLVDQSALNGLDLHDSLHPNEVGYAKMAYRWYTAMATVFRGSGPAWPTGGNPFKAAAALRIMPLGDSITWGPRENANSYRVDLAARLKSAGVRADFVGSQHSGYGPDVDHEGHSHWTIAMISAQIDGWLATYRPDVVLLHIGTNDLQDADHAAEAPARLYSLIDRIAIDLPNTDVFVAKVIASKVPDRNLRTDAYNERLAGIVADAGPRFHLVDQSAVGALDLRDNLHPNAFGYAKMAYTWYHALEAVFDTSSTPWLPGANPFTATSAYLCQAYSPDSFTSVSDCRWWAYRPTWQVVGGETVQVRRWQTVRLVAQRYTVLVAGHYLQTVKRVRAGHRWTHRKTRTWVGTHTSTRTRQIPTWVNS